MRWVYRRLADSRDARVVIVLAVVAAAFGMFYVRTWGGVPHFFQELYGPAVLFACGHGFGESPVPGQSEALDAFLRPLEQEPPGSVPCFDCGRLPDEIATQPWDAFERRQRYQLLAGGLLWRMFGVCWAALTPLYGLFFGMSAAALYGLFRLAIPRVPAMLFTLLLVTSPIQLNNLVRLRDYSKAPFLLLAMLCIGLIVVLPFKKKRVLALAACAGLVLGIGVGFRMDVVMAAPPFLAALFLFSPTGLWEGLRTKALAAAVFLGVFFLAGAPVLLSLGTSMKYQDFILGLNSLYDSRLGVGDAPYQINHRYFDREPYVTLQGYALHTEGQAPAYLFDTPEYEAIGRDYTMRILRTFPADLMTRTLAAVERTLDELTTNVHSPPPRGWDGAIARTAYTVHSGITQALTRFAKYAAVLALVLLSLRSLRLAFAGYFLLLYFAGYGAIQFASRHYFHMQFAALFAVALVAAAAIWTWKQRGGLRDKALRPWAACGRAVAFVTVAVLAIVLPMQTLRWYQDTQVRPILEAYAEAETGGVEIQWQTLDNGHRLAQGIDSAGHDTLPVPADTPYFKVEFLMATFDTTEAPVNVEVRYAGSIHDTTLTWSIMLPQTEDGPTRLYFPAYTAVYAGTGGHWTSYQGIALAEEDAPRLIALARVDDPAQFPLLLTVRLAPNWENAPLYQSKIR
jgi:hypothetical protein